VRGCHRNTVSLFLPREEHICKALESAPALFALLFLSSRNGVRFFQQRLTLARVDHPQAAPLATHTPIAPVRENCCGNATV